MPTQTVPMWRTLAETDPEIAAAVRNELHRQNSGLELIASENSVSRAVLEAAGTVFTNKYAEGYPGRRYYGGCEFVGRRRDRRHHPRESAVRRGPCERAAAFRGAGQHGRVLHAPQAGRHRPRHEPGARRPPDARPPVEFLGRLFTIVPYGVRQDDERIDYDELDRLADEHRPKMIIVGASAYPRVIDFARDQRGGRRASAPR